MSSARRLLTLAPDDDVAIALDDLAPGERLADLGPGLPAGEVADRVPRGHKIALRDLAKGAPVRKYGQVIGMASAPIQVGTHVHTHNLAFAPHMQGGDVPASVVSHTPAGVSDTTPTFDGYVRADGRVGTRNYVGIVTSVNCSATVARLIAREAERRLRPSRTSTAWCALTHGTGCGMTGEGEGARLLRRTLRGYAEHPNFAAVLAIGLGCEVQPAAAAWTSPSGQPPRR